MIDNPTASAVETLARLGSFREAAAALGTSPATLSRRIAQAEDYAGQPLFERKRSGTTLTSAGEGFVRLIKDLKAAETDFQRGVARLRGTEADILAIGCGPLTTRNIVAPSLIKLLNLFPDLRMRVDVRATKEPLEALRAGRIDIAICDLTHTPDLSDLEIQLVKRLPITFWARPEHPIHSDRPIPLTDVLRQPIMTPFVHKHWRSSVAEALGGDEAAWHVAETIPQIESDDYGLLTELACRYDIVCGGMSETFSELSQLGRLKRIATTTQMQWNICCARKTGHSFGSLDALWTILARDFGLDA